MATIIDVTRAWQGTAGAVLEASPKEAGPATGAATEPATGAATEPATEVHAHARQAMGRRLRYNRHSPSHEWFSETPGSPNPRWCSRGRCWTRPPRSPA